jgi:polyphosphate kinase 2 (PPK2 family)
MNFAKVAKKIVKQCRVDNPRHFKLDDHDPAETFGLSTSIGDVEAILAQGIARIIDLQQRLYAHGQWAVLLVFQGMDAAGKDGVVKHVMSGINPQGCEVHAFKAPSSEELEHDFLWRTGRDVPARGRIGIFNRSHYGQGYLETPFQGDSRLRTPPDAQRHAGVEIPLAHFQGRTAQAFSGAAR